MAMMKRGLLQYQMIQNQFHIHVLPPSRHSKTTASMRKAGIKDDQERKKAKNGQLPILTSFSCRVMLDGICERAHTGKMKARRP